MSDRLHIGTVARMIGVSSETLRVYGKKKVIEPLRNQENGYRYYPRSFVTSLFKARYLKSMGFTISEITHQNATGIGHINTPGLCLEDWLCCLDERQKVLALELHRKQIVLEQVHKYRQRVAGIQTLLNAFTLERNEEMLFFDFSDENDEMANSPQVVEEIRKWVDLFPISRYAFVCTKENLRHLGMSGNFRRGFAMSAQDAQQHGIGCNEAVCSIPPQYCVHTIARINRLETSSTKMLESAMKYIESASLAIVSDAYGFWLTNAKEGRDCVKYYEIWIPVKHTIK